MSSLCPVMKSVEAIIKMRKSNSNKRMLEDVGCRDIIEMDVIEIHSEMLLIDFKIQWKEFMEMIGEIKKVVFNLEEEFDKGAVK